MVRIHLMAAALLLFASNFALGAGALAIDENQGDQWGWAVNYQTLADAERRALRECGYGCTIVMTFQGGCAAYAADQSYGSTIYGYAYGFRTSGEAQNHALYECRRRGGASCVVRVWGCDS